MVASFFFFLYVQEALEMVRIPRQDQEHAFAILAAVLWLGNILFRVTSHENHVEVVVDEGNFYVLTFGRPKYDEFILRYQR